MTLQASPGSTSPFAGARATVDAHLVRAHATLRAGDVRAFAASLHAAGRLDDPQSRYLARRLTAQLALAATGGTPELAARFLATALDAVVCDLEGTPAEPVLLELAGLALTGLGDRAGATALAAAARRLDPTAQAFPTVSADAIAARGPLATAALPADVQEAVRDLGARARAAADAARPATGLTIALTMIVRDEEAMLGRTLAAARTAVDELVVVDTGSTDRTVEIALEHGARVLHHPWTGHFAEARNVAMDAATADWLLVLDADEVLVEADAALLRELAGRTWREAFYLRATNHTGELGDGSASTTDSLRLLRNRPGHRYEGRIHEQIAHRLPGFVPERVERTAVRFEHFGYLGEVREAKDKSARNLELLERQRAEGDDSPFLHFNLGSEHLVLGSAPTAAEHFLTAWRRIRADRDPTSFGFAPSLGSRMLKALNASGRAAEALELGDDVLRLLPGYTDVVLEQGRAALALGDTRRAAAQFRQALELGDAPTKWHGAVGAGGPIALVELARVQRAEQDHAGARATLERCAREHPGFHGVAEPLAELLLASGTPAAGVPAAVEAVTGALSPADCFQVAVPLYEAGAVAEAEGLLRRVLQARPHVHHARVVLAEALLSQGRLEEAAAEVAHVPPTAGCAAAAARTAAFVALATGGDADLDAAAHAGLPDDELAAFRAWAGQDVAVPAAAAPVLATMLDALARLERFEAFEALARAVDALALPARERRELLAGVYLRRGFLDSAAEEWIAAVQEDGPDARALDGLARIADARGLHDDAEVFRTEARTLLAAAA
ncbi:glycosyltransferase family 2 protein [Conexibacter sp. SYSU D00693]|uniref:glycosyltransferase family 2 protein n=1 Tax=Conexibacter sp. SYSU D00693 TaxID=2812560 RepID=UPI00196B4D5B|nr:glycosyltransferase family 2 protein [Conexibacter sp. SYSU D00693]